MRTNRTLGPDNPKFQNSLVATCDLFQAVIDNSTPMEWLDEELENMDEAMEDICTMANDEAYSHLFSEDCFDEEDDDDDDEDDDDDDEDEDEDEVGDDEDEDEDEEEDSFDDEV